MSWIMPNTFLWNLILASGIIDQSLLMLVGPGLQVLTWSATSGYDFYKWIRSKPKERLIIIECNSSHPVSPSSAKHGRDRREDSEDEEEEFLLITSTVSETK